MNFNYENKVALVTGAAIGIGYATAKMFAEAKASVVLADIDEEKLNEAVQSLKDLGHNVIGVKCDVSNEEEVKSLVKTAVDTFGSIDLACNNAGVQAPVAYTAEAEVEDFRRVLDINLLGVWYCMKYELQEMIKQNNGGAIVNMSSQDAIVGTAGLGAYTASKTAVLGITKCAALEYAEDNIQINAVCPGVIDTPMVSQAIEDYPEHMQAITDAIPKKRFGKPEEIASTVLWLCDEGAAYITGQVIIPDGGFTIQ